MLFLLLKVSGLSVTKGRLKDVLLLLIGFGLAGCAGLQNSPSKLSAEGDSLPPANEFHQPKPWGNGAESFPYARWLSTGQRTKGVVIFAPGWDGTMSDYAMLAEYLSKHGYAVYGSEGRAGVFDPEKQRWGDMVNYSDWVNDLEGFTKFVARKCPGLPIFYHRHSLGTLVAAETTAEAMHRDGFVHPKGLILHSMAMPALRDKKNPVIHGLLDSIAWMRFPLVKLAEITHKGPMGDPDLNSCWLHSSDRLPRGYTLRYVSQVAALGRAVWKSSAALRLPVLALEGEKDNVVAPTDAEKWRYDQFLRYRLAGGDATVIRYHEGFHLLTLPRTGNPKLDNTTEQALRDITQWLDLQVASE